MSRSNFPGTLLVLEGHTDSKFWSYRISKTECQIVIAGSKPTVIGAVVRANGIPIAGVLGIVDDDYDSLCGIPLPSPNILRTECRDLEAILFKSPALEKVIYELGDATKIFAFEAAEGTPVRNALIARSLLFGKIRWLDRQKGWNFDFDRLSPWRFGDDANWAIDEAGVLTIVAATVGHTVADLNRLLVALPIGDHYLVVHGNDTAVILAMGLKRKLGNYQHPPERICQVLRLAFEDGMARNTRLFTEIINWEATNPPYRVLM